MEEPDLPLVLVRTENVRQRLLRCDGVTDEDLSELAISYVLDRVTIELLDSFDFWSVQVLGRSIRFLSKIGLPRYLGAGNATVSGTKSAATSSNVFDWD